MLNIEEAKDYKIALHHLGFRPFFLAATIFSVVSIFVWAWLYHIDANGLLHLSLNATTWHAHEMIFAYTFAVIAGFLLTAVGNWTNVQTLHGVPLMLLALLWLGARLAPFFQFTDAIVVMALLDMAFNVFFLLAIVHPIVLSKQWGQMGIVVIATLLCMSNGIFYLGMFDQVPGGMQAGLYSGLYLCVFLIMVMGRRVIPFFIEKGVDADVAIRNRQWVDISSMILMLTFVVLEVFLQQVQWAAVCVFILFILQVIRLYDWYTPGIWKKSLLWSLYIAYSWITVGFAMKAIGPVLSVNPMLATHALAYGGIGLMTLGMMSRVALGHTGRNVFQPPKILQWLFLILAIGIVVRVILPMFLSEHYTVLIGISQILWIIAFAGFVLVYMPMLIKPRVDGRYG